MIWLQRDPLGQLAGPDEYAYVMGEPRDFYDPMGLASRQPEIDPGTNRQIEYPGKKGGRPGVFLYYYTEEFTWWGPQGSGTYPTTDPPKQVFVPDENRDLDMLDDEGATKYTRASKAWLDAAADASYVAIDQSYAAAIFILAVATPLDETVLVEMAAKYALRRIEVLISGEIRALTIEGKFIKLAAEDEVKILNTNAAKRELEKLKAEAAKAAEDTKRASRGGQSPTKGEGCPEDSPRGKSPSASDRVGEKFKDPADAIGDLNGEATLVGKGKTKEQFWRKSGFTETEYYRDSNGTKWTVFKNPRTGEYSGAHPSSGQ